ncbi:response regulator [Daejeonella sp.]|uniref:response regulator n=1 Tax=Daejeonella sp. TaxID=2805397 RepID=UPI0030C00A52
MSKISLVSIIDDDAIFQFLANRLLRSTNLIDKIIQFPDGEKAINYFIENKDIAENIPDLVFLDLNMPYIDGWQFLEKFIAISFPKELITIYICTSSNSLFDQKRFTEYPKLKGYLIKPIDKEKFLEVVQNELGL